MWPSAVDELLEQRDAIMFGEWVQRPPRADNEACAVIRGVRVSGYVAALGHLLILQAIDNLFGEKWSNAACWNDTRGRTKEQVLSVLDEAIRIAKGQA